jgi:hypothetical protein
MIFARPGVLPSGRFTGAGESDAGQAAVDQSGAVLNLAQASADVITPEVRPTSLRNGCCW